MRVLKTLGLALCFTNVVAASDDVVVADFEQETYGDWQIDGTAFGPGPAMGTLPGQMNVSGYQGERLVNSFVDGDASTGTLTSPPLEINRGYLTFLIGGGGHEGQTCMNLLKDGEVVRTAVGPNTQPGGSEALEPQFWDVRDLRGKQVTIQIVDRATGGWGHINVDQIVLTDEKPRLPEYRRQEKSFTIEKPLLVIPIKNGAKQTELTLEVEGTPVRRYGLELATDPAAVDWYAFFTIKSYLGRPAKVTVARGTAEAFALLQQADEVPGSDAWYSEDLRPQFHFSQKVGWNNDPNGMVYLDGEWHLFFQHNPVGWKWGNMTWGHAVSKDLVHWRQLPNVLFPGTMAKGACFSGGATIDPRNTAGWQTGDNDVLVAFLTDTGAGEAVAYSNDRGRSFTWYAENPVVTHRGRDPKVIWYAYGPQDTPLSEAARRFGGHWVMAVFDEHPEFERNIAFYTSIDLKDWTEQSHLPGFYECPELFELSVDGDDGNTRWVIFAADARYVIGDFDGRQFVPAHDGKHQVHHGSYYASQTFDNAPGNRRIQIGWVRLAMPGMPFNQTFSFPHELTLRTTGDGIRMFARPVNEIDQLHQKRHVAEGHELMEDSPVRQPVSGRLFDVRATFEPGDARRVGLDIGGNVVTYDVAEQSLNGASLKLVDGRVSMQVLVDRPMIEICGNDGAVFITSGREHRGDVREIKAFAEGGTARLVRLEVFELTSIWETEKSARFDPVQRDLEGWTVHIDPSLVDGEHQDEGERAIAMLANHLQRIRILVPAAALDKLQEVEIWIEHQHPRIKGMQYHPSCVWLAEHGHDPRLTRKVHIPQARQLLSREQMLKHPAVVLHELAHGYHHQILGFDDPEIIRVFAQAKAGGTYENVLLYTSQNVRHYGLTDHKEYFAEGTEAFFYRNDFYPFVRAELKQHDPTLHDLLQRVWIGE